MHGGSKNTPSIFPAAYQYVSSVFHMAQAKAGLFPLPLPFAHHRSGAGLRAWKMSSAPQMVRQALTWSPRSRSFSANCFRV